MSSCARCTDTRPPPIRRRDGKGQQEVRNGAVRTAEYTSIRVPLLRLFEADGSIQSSILTGASALQESGKPRRPCVVFDSRQQLICLMCTFGGNPPPDVFRKFLVPVYPNVVRGEDHLHSVPEWNHKYDQWILAIPFKPRVADLELLPEWLSRTMRDGAHFDGKTLRELKVLGRRLLQEWKDMAKDNPDFVRQVEVYLASWEDNISRPSTRRSCATKWTYDSTRSIGSVLSRMDMNAGTPPVHAPQHQYPYSKATPKYAARMMSSAASVRSTNRFVNGCLPVQEEN
ncbi:hypothetical protein C8F01DRAFT_1260615 [Mycena amicta]|nr:hypothetical protein C8F01DRAFT_1260615 [Mycena amicta]